jgi:hypothetical protein
MSGPWPSRPEHELPCDMCKRSDRPRVRVSRLRGVHVECVDQPACADDWWRRMQQHEAEKRAAKRNRARERRASEKGS